MTHVEYLEKLLKEYQKKTIEINSDENFNSFWRGACFALAIAIRNLKEGKMMLDKLKKFFDNEYNSTKRWIESPYEKQYQNKKEAIKCALQRGLGASFFAQSIGIEYEHIEKLYNEYKEKIERLGD